MRPLDWETHAKVTDAISRAGKNDRDVAEYLHSYGLLATPQWRARIEGDAIAKAAAFLEALPVPVLLGHKWATGHYTASDVAAGLLEVLRELEKVARSGDL